MTDAEVSGPIDFVLLEFPDQDPTGDVATALMDLVAADTIRVFDILAIRKDASGKVSGFDISDLSVGGVGGFAAFAGARSGLLSDDDVADAAAAMNPSTVAVLLVYENRWAVPFVSAALDAGGQMIASARIPTQDIADVLDALEASD